MKEQEFLYQEDATISHSEIQECQCEKCVKAKDRYVRIIYVERLVDNLNDWD